MEMKLWFAIWLVVGVTLARQVGAVQVGKGLTKDNVTVEELISEEMFSTIFPHKDSMLAHAIGFYDYRSFVAACAIFAKDGFGLVGGSQVQIKELSAFLAHVSHETSCGWSGSKDGPYAWGLCYKEELSPPSIYCKQDIIYQCVNGVSYHGRGCFPLYYNTNYGPVGNALGHDLLSYPGLIANNATMAFASAIYLWMTPQKPNPSPHSVMVGKWKPSKVDIDNFREAGFGLTINILAGQIECGHGDDPRAGDRINNYLRIARLMGAKDYEDNLDCGLQGMYPTGYTSVPKISLKSV